MISGSSSFKSVLLLAITMAGANTARGDESAISTPYNYQPEEPGKQAFLLEDAGELEQLYVRRGIRYSHLPIEELLEHILYRLAPPLTDAYISYRIYLIRDPSPIAFSLLDGQIYLHSGLLARLENESQLAAVVAHEIHHIAAHHHISAHRNRQSKEAGTQTVTAIADILLMTGGGLTAVANTLAFQAKTTFGVDAEMEADHYGLQLMEAAGYDPDAAHRVLELILEDPEFVTPRLLGAWSTQDEFDARLAALDQANDPVAPEVQAATAKSPEQIRPITRSLIMMTIDDYIRVDHPGTAVGLCNKLLAVLPDDDNLHAAKGDALKALGPRAQVAEQVSKRERRRRDRLTRAELFDEFMATEAGKTHYKRNQDQAQSAYEHAININAASSRAHHGLGELLFERADYRRAARHYIQYLQLNPDAIDRSIVIDQLQKIRSRLQTNTETP